MRSKARAGVLAHLKPKPRNWTSGFWVGRPGVCARSPKKKARNNCHFLKQSPDITQSPDFKQNCCEPQDLRHPQASLVLRNSQSHPFNYRFSPCTLTLILQRSSFSGDILFHDLGILRVAIRLGT